MAGIGFVVKNEPEPGAGAAYLFSRGGRILANACGEYHAVQAAWSGSQGSDITTEAIAEKLYRKLGALVLAR
jgi:hypothetical protein